MIQVTIVTDEHSATAMLSPIVAAGDDTPTRRTTEEIAPFTVRTFEVTEHLRLSVRANEIAEPGADIDAPVT